MVNSIGGCEINYIFYNRETTFFKLSILFNHRLEVRKVKLFFLVDENNFRKCDTVILYFTVIACSLSIDN